MLSSMFVRGARARNCGPVSVDLEGDSSSRTSQRSTAVSPRNRAAQPLDLIGKAVLKAFKIASNSQPPRDGGKLFAAARHLPRPVSPHVRGASRGPRAARVQLLGA